MPPTLRAQWEGWLQRGGKEALSRLLAAWSSARPGSAEFESRFLPNSAGARVGAAAHDLADAVATGAPEASTKLAELVQTVGLDGWPRFVAAAEDKAAAVPAHPAMGNVIPVQGPFIEIPRLFAKPPEEVVPRYMERVPKQSGKEAADDIPSWARGKPWQIGETPDQYAGRLVEEKYGKSGWRPDRMEEFRKLKKWGSRAFRVPRTAVPMPVDNDNQA